MTAAPPAESDATLRLQQQILAALTDDPGAVPDLIIDLGLIDRPGACRVMGALKAAESVADHEEAGRG